MTTFRSLLAPATLATAVLGSLAAPVLAQPAPAAHGVRTAHHRAVRHATVHRIAAQGPATTALSTQGAAMPGASSVASPMVPATSGTPRVAVASPAAPAMPVATVPGPVTGVAGPVAGTLPRTAAAPSSVTPGVAPSVTLGSGRPGKPGVITAAPASASPRLSTALPGVPQPGAVRVN